MHGQAEKRELAEDLAGDLGVPDRATLRADQSMPAPTSRMFSCRRPSSRCAG